MNMSSKSKAQKSRFKVKRPGGSSSSQLQSNSKLRDLHSSSELDQLMRTGKPVIIDFWAEWCAPCKATAPAFAAAAEQYGEQVHFCKVNTEKAQSLAREFNIRSIPTLVMMHEGEVVDVHIGMSNQTTIERLAKKLIARVDKQQAKAAKDVPVDSEDNVVPLPTQPSGLLNKVKALFASM